MNKDNRDLFDKHFEIVFARLPPLIHSLLEKMPLHVEDGPPGDVLDQLGISSAEYLCGLYTGVPLTERSIERPWKLPDVVTIYRLGILRQATDDAGRVSLDELERQIWITILHEVGHHHGLDEDDLAKLGYG